MRPLQKVTIKWSPEFAYAIGLLVTDGCLYKDGRYIDFTSRDIEQIKNFMYCLGIDIKIGQKTSGHNHNICWRIQFGDINFYHFLSEIGLMPRKSKVLQEVDIPEEYFFDFLRGHFDGDGTFYSYSDPRWRSSYMFYTVFISASEKHILWLRKKIFELIGIKGHLTKNGKTPIYEVRYAKAESLQLLPKLYYNREVVCLSRKRKKIEKALAVEGRRL